VVAVGTGDKDAMNQHDQSLNRVEHREENIDYQEKESEDRDVEDARNGEYDGAEDYHGQGGHEEKNPGKPFLPFLGEVTTGAFKPLRSGFVIHLPTGFDRVEEITIPFPEKIASAARLNVVSHLTPVSD